MRLPGRRGAPAAAVALLVAGAAAAAERTPSGWNLLSPCEGNCALAVYGGSYVEDSMSDVLILEPAFPTDWNFAEGDKLAAVALSRHAASWGPIDFEPELGIARRFGQSVTEVWAALYARYRGFPWDDVVETSFAVSTGVNIASRYSDVEIERTEETSGYRLMHFFAPEVTFALPDRPGVELLLRFHHRSGAFGLLNDVGGGAQYGTVGLRLRF